MDLTTCPGCGAPDAVEWRAVLDSTDGPIEHARVSCVQRHWFCCRSTSRQACHRASHERTLWRMGGEPEPRAGGSSPAPRWDRAGQARPLRCLLGFHQWAPHLAPSGEKYLACVRCQKPSGSEPIPPSSGAI